MVKCTKIEQMAHEMSLTLTTKLFLGSLRASRAIKKQKKDFQNPNESHYLIQKFVHDLMTNNLLYLGAALYFGSSRSKIV